MRFGSGLALFALMLQLALSFGHIHPEDLFGRGSGSGHALVQPNPAGAPDQQLPTHDEDCPICSVMHLAGTIVVPSPPLLVLPTAQWARPLLPNEPAELIVVRRASPFRTRAPPQA